MRTLKIGFLEFLPQDIKKMRFNDAVKYCEHLGEGWRLPTFQEMDLLFMELNRLGVGGFKNKTEEAGSYFIHPYYWVKKEEYEKPMCWSFIKGDGEYMPETRAFWFRPVRSI